MILGIGSVWTKGYIQWIKGKNIFSVRTSCEFQDCVAKLWNFALCFVLAVQKRMEWNVCTMKLMWSVVTWSSVVGIQFQKVCLCRLRYISPIFNAASSVYLGFPGAGPGYWYKCAGCSDKIYPQLISCVRTRPITRHLSPPLIRHVGDAGRCSEWQV